MPSAPTMRATSAEEMTAPSGRRRDSVTMVPAGWLVMVKSSTSRRALTIPWPAVRPSKTASRSAIPGPRSVTRTRTAKGSDRVIANDDPAAPGIGERISRDLRNRSRQPGLAGRVQPGQRGYLPSTMACHDDVLGLGQGQRSTAAIPSCQPFHTTTDASSLPRAWSRYSTPAISSGSNANNPG